MRLVRINNRYPKIVLQRIRLENYDGEENAVSESNSPKPEFHCNDLRNTSHNSQQSFNFNACLENEPAPKIKSKNLAFEHLINAFKILEGNDIESLTDNETLKNETNLASSTRTLSSKDKLQQENKNAVQPFEIDSFLKCKPGPRCWKMRFCEKSKCSKQYLTLRLRDKRHKPGPLTWKIRTHRSILPNNIEEISIAKLKNVRIKQSMVISLKSFLIVTNDINKQLT